MSWCCISGHQEITRRTWFQCYSDATIVDQTIIWKRIFLYKRKTVSIIQCMKVDRYMYKDIYIKKQLKSIDLYFSIAFCQRSLYIFICTFYTQVLIHIPIENIWILESFNPLSANPTKWSSTLKQFLGNNWQIFSVCLTILWGWCLKRYV